MLRLAGPAPSLRRPLSSNLVPRTSLPDASVLFAVLFTDNAGMGALRAEHLEAHIAWVEDNKSWVLVAGSLRHEPQDVPRGGLWVVEAESKNDVLEKMKSDPFFCCGLRQSVEVLHWSKALQHHKSLI